MEVISQNSKKQFPGNNKILVIGDALIDHQYWIDTMPNPGEDTVILSPRRMLAVRPLIQQSD
jgi:hypothetical protein